MRLLWILLIAGGLGLGCTAQAPTNDGGDTTDDTTGDTGSGTDDTGPGDDTGDTTGDVDDNDPGAQPQDYFTIERADGFFLSRFEDDGIIQRLQRLHWWGYMHVAHTLTHCGDAFGTVLQTMSKDQAIAYIAEGEALEAEGGRFKANFEKVNRRCSEQPAFCGRVEVSKARWQDYVARFDAHMVGGETLSAESLHVGQTSGCTAIYDNVMGWCDLCYSQQ